MSGITMKLDSQGHISLEMGSGAWVAQPCRPGRFYVYTHKDKNGVVFYVGKGTGDRAHSSDRPAEWHEYVEKRSDGKFSIEIVRDGISEEDALEIEDAVMKVHGGTIVNRANPHAPYDLSKFHAYCEAQKSFGAALRRAIDLQKAKQFERAIPEFEAAYALHSEMVRNADYDLGARRGLSSTAFTYHPSSTLVDGYSLVLSKTGRNRELIAFAEQYFRDYPPPYYRAEEKLRSRLGKAKEQLASLSCSATQAHHQER